jgi:hypothetical protein
LYDVESSFSESVATHLARILSRRGIADASFLCFVFRACAGPALRYR